MHTRTGMCPCCRRMVILCTPIDVITTGIRMGTRIDTDMITRITATAIVTMAMHLLQRLLWPALVFRWALSRQPGMPVHAICAGPLVMAMMPVHALCRGPLVAARHTAHTLYRALATGISGWPSASPSALGCNALGFAVVAPSAMPASSRPGQWLLSRGKGWDLRLAVLPQLWL
jgi:hypothetical protein